MGIETVVSEPPKDAFDMLDRLCQEYKIQLAIHNHPKPSHYWDPDTVVKVCKGRSKCIGACADTGQWVRSGLDPVECLKKLDGRIITACTLKRSTMGLFGRKNNILRIAGAEKLLKSFTGFDQWLNS